MLQIRSFVAHCNEAVFDPADINSNQIPGLEVFDHQSQTMPLTDSVKLSGYPVGALELVLASAKTKQHQTNGVLELQHFTLEVHSHPNRWWRDNKTKLLTPSTM